MHRLTIRTRAHTQFLPLDDELNALLRQSGIENGLCHVFIPHTTAGVTINENADPDVVADIIATLERMVPWENRYAHSEGNSAAHAKASLMGSSARIIVSGGRLKLGTWQGIFLCEFDGPRRRRVQVRILAAPFQEA